MKTIKETLELTIGELDNAIYTVRSAGTARGLRDIKKTLTALLPRILNDDRSPVVKVMASHRFDPTIMICERICSNEIVARRWVESEEGKRTLFGRHVQLVWEDVL